MPPTPATACLECFTGISDDRLVAALLSADPRVALPEICRTVVQAGEEPQR